MASPEKPNTNAHTSTKPVKNADVPVDLSTRPSTSNASIRKAPLSRTQSSILQFIHSSVTVIKEAIQATVAVFVGEDGCEPRHCRKFALTIAIPLLLFGLWAILLWIDDVLEVLITHKRPWSKYFKPNIFWIGSQVSVALASFQPLFSATWLIAACNLQTHLLLHWYLKITPWLIIHPLLVIIYFCLYCGYVTEGETEILLRNKIELFNPKSSEEVEEWLRVHSRFKCCGATSWKDWIDVNEFEEEKVPRSCCISPPPQQQENFTAPGCPWLPDGSNTYPKGCLRYVYLSHSFWVGSMLLALVLSVVFTCFSVYAASRYYERLIQEFKRDYVHTWTQLWKECLCPCKPYDSKTDTESGKPTASPSTVVEAPTVTTVAAKTASPSTISSTPTSSPSSISTAPTINSRNKQLNKVKQKV